MSIEERLESLEAAIAQSRARGRRLTVLTILGIAAAFAAGFVAQQSKPSRDKEIRATSFILEDESGKNLAALAVTKDGPGLLFLDEKGKHRALLLASKDTTGLMLFDLEGNPRTLLDAGQATQGLWLSDDKGVTRAEFCLSNEGKSVLMLNDEKARARATLVADKDGPSLVLGDEKGNTRARLGVGKATSVDGTVTIFPESSLSLCGPDGKRIWSAP